MCESKMKMNAKNRSDSAWVAALSGRIGNVAQCEAIEDLARYLYVVVYNNLLSRRRGIALLKKLANDEISALAMDFTQHFMEKMVHNQYQLLDKYHGKGRFTHWAAQVALRMVSSEFRRSHWRQQVPLEEQAALLSKPSVAQEALPEEAAANAQLHDLLQRCIARLPNRMQRAFVRRVVDGEPAAVVALEMGVSANAINLLVHRAKKMLRELLEDNRAGLDEALT